MEQKRIDRINELSRLARQRELTNEEKAERERLRREYVDAFKSSLVSQLENTYYIDQNGFKRKVKRGGKKRG